METEQFLGEWLPTPQPPPVATGHSLNLIHSTVYHEVKYNQKICQLTKYTAYSSAVTAEC